MEALNKHDLWMEERHLPGLKLSYKVEKMLDDVKSDYCRITVYQTEDLGKLFTIDGVVMLTEKHEFIYHEMLTHVAMFTHENPKNILIIGGGDGGIAKEVFKHKSVENVDMVEIDKKVVEISKKYFPEIAVEMFDNKNLHIHYEDGIKYAKEYEKEKYDIIIIDSTDPIDYAEGLFSENFYKDCKNILKVGGILVTQSESPFFYLDFIKKVKLNFKTNFSKYKLFTAAIPTYQSGLWAFSIGSDKYNPENIDINKINTDGINLKYYNKNIHRASFVLPEFCKSINE